MKNNEELKKEILRLTAEYSRRLHQDFRPSDDINRKSWIPGETIPYAGRVFNEQEVVAALNAAGRDASNGKERISNRPKIVFADSKKPVKKRKSYFKSSDLD